MEFVILTFLLVFQVAQSQRVTVQTLHVRSSHFLCYLPSLMKPPSTYLIQQLAGGDRNLAVVSHTIQRHSRIISRPAVHTCLRCFITAC